MDSSTATQRERAKETHAPKSNAQKQTQNAKTSEQVYCISFLENFADAPKPENLTWNAFYERYINIKPKPRLTKGGRLFTSAIFNGRRTKENIISRQWLELDYDALDLEPIKAHWKQSGFQHFFYTTYSHKQVVLKDDKNPHALPCGRIVIELASAIPANLYNALYDWASEQTGGNADNGCKGANRALYLPAIANDKAEYYSFSVDGKPFDWSDLGLKEEQAPKPSAKSVKGKSAATDSKYDFVLNENASAPARIERLLENDDFLQLWDRKNSDLKKDDSRYDYHISKTLLKLDWNMQDIVDSMVAVATRNSNQSKPQ